jgi:hypothetical protein
LEKVFWTRQKKILILTQNQAIPFGSDMRDQAILLQTYLLLGNKKDASSLAHHIATKLGNNSWYATFSKAYGIWSVASYLNKYPTAKNIVATYSIRGKSYNVNQEGSSYFINLNKKTSFSSANNVNKGKGNDLRDLSSKRQSGIDRSNENL